MRVLIARQQAQGFALLDEEGYPALYPHTEEEAEYEALGLADPGAVLRFEYLDGTEREILL